MVGRAPLAWRQSRVRTPFRVVFVGQVIKARRFASKLFLHHAWHGHDCARDFALLFQVRKRAERNGRLAGSNAQGKSDALGDFDLFDGALTLDAHTRTHVDVARCRRALF